MAMIGRGVVLAVAATSAGYYGYHTAKDRLSLPDVSIPSVGEMKESLMNFSPLTSLKKGWNSVVITSTMYLHDNVSVSGVKDSLVQGYETVANKVKGSDESE